MPGFSRLSTTNLPTFLGSFLLAISALTSQIVALEPLPTIEYQVKASFLSHFLSYVEWPEGTFVNQSDSLVIAIVGDNRFGTALDSIAKDEPISRPIKLQSVSSSFTADNCHLLYFVNEGKDHRALEFVRGEHKGLLTIGECDGFSKAGGMINFVIVNGKLRFEINSYSVRRAGLAINSELLKLATKVYNNELVTDK